MLRAYASASCIRIAPSICHPHMHGRTDERTHVDVLLSTPYTSHCLVTRANKADLAGVK